MRRPAAAALLLLALGGCGRALDEAAPVDGEYRRGAFHLYLWCPDQTPSWRALDLMYPANAAGSTWKLEEDGFDLTVSWAGVPVASGRRTSEGIDLDFTRLDAFSQDEVDLRFRGRMREDLRFHDRTIVGRIEGDYDGCVVHPNSVAWMTVGPRPLADVELDPQESAGAAGRWSRFVWFLDIGPYGMRRKGDPGQRGRNLRLFSFATTGAGEIVAGDDVAFFDNGFGEYWEGAAEGSAATFDQPGDYWELEYAQELLFDDGGGGGSPGIHRVLSGFVTGRYRVSAENYPFGWEGATGMLALNNPGLGFWLDLVRVPEAPAPAAAVVAPPAGVHAEEFDPADLRPLVLRVEDGALAW